MVNRLNFVAPKLGKRRPERTVTAPPPPRPPPPPLARHLLPERGWVWSEKPHRNGKNVCEVHQHQASFGTISQRVRVGRGRREGRKHFGQRRVSERPVFLSSGASFLPFQVSESEVWKAYFLLNNERSNNGDGGQREKCLGRTNRVCMLHSLCSLHSRVVWYPFLACKNKHQKVEGACTALGQQAVVAVLTFLGRRGLG